jgi:hypothetical protein
MLLSIMIVIGAIMNKAASVSAHCDFSTEIDGLPPEGNSGPGGIKRKGIGAMARAGRAVATALADLPVSCSPLL